MQPTSSPDKKRGGGWSYAFIIQSERKGKTMLRWGVAIFCSLAAMLIFMLLVLRSEKARESLPTIISQLDYMILQKNPPERPKKEPPKPPPPPKEPITKSKPAPLAEAPVEAAPEAAVTPDLVASPAPAPKPPAPPKIFSIRSAEDLDNISFEPLYNPKPAYPAIAREAGLSGYVDVDLEVDTLGFVRSFSIARIEGHPAFGAETEKVLPKWRFPPPRKNGRPIMVKYLYRVWFRLH